MKKLLAMDIKLFLHLCITLYYSVINNFSVRDMYKKNNDQIDYIFKEIKKDKLLRDINRNGISKTFNGAKLKPIIESTLNDLKLLYVESTVFSHMEIVIDYFIIKVRKLILESAKFKTNDISDMLILSSLYAFKEDETILLTHDKDLKSFLKFTKNNHSLEFMESNNI